MTLAQRNHKQYIHELTMVERRGGGGLEGGLKWGFFPLFSGGWGVGGGTCILMGGIFKF